MFLIISCGTSKKIKESTTIKKTTVEINNSIKDSIVNAKKTKMIEKDSIVNIEKTLPTENEIEFDLDDFETVDGDFKSTVKSGETETIIEKKGSKVKITTKTSGHKSVETNVTKNEIQESEKETKVKEVEKNDKVESSESEKEKIKKVVRIPFWIKIIFVIVVSLVLIYIFRKQILKILSTFFPALKLTKIFSFIMGLKKE